VAPPAFEKKLRARKDRPPTGNYWFTHAKTGAVAKAEYTFQRAPASVRRTAETTNKKNRRYARAADGSLKITVHHSSFPYAA